VTAPDLSAVIRKVQRLRRLAKSTSPHEAAAAAAAADALLQKYRIDDATIRNATTGPAAEPLVTWALSMLRRRAWEVRLANAVCLHYDVAYYWLDFEGRRAVRMSGAEADVAIVRLMFRWLKSECLRLGKAEKPVLRSSFRWGMVLGIEAAMFLAKREALRALTQQAAIVLRDRLASARSAMYEERPDLAAGSIHQLQPVDPRASEADRDEAEHRGFLAGKDLDVKSGPGAPLREEYVNNVRTVDFRNKRKRRGPF
jgi:Protein of unknown function (DUF2786)